MNKCLSCLNINITICNGLNNMLILRSSVTYIPIIFFGGYRAGFLYLQGLLGFMQIYLEIKPNFSFSGRI